MRFWLSMESQKRINPVIMDIHNSIMDIHNSIMDIHNSIMDIHNPIMDIHISIMDIHNPIMDIHISIMDIHISIMDIHNWLWISIIIGFMRFWLSIMIQRTSPTSWWWTFALKKGRVYISVINGSSGVLQLFWIVS